MQECCVQDSVLSGYRSDCTYRRQYCLLSLKPSADTRVDNRENKRAEQAIPVHASRTMRPKQTEKIPTEERTDDSQKDIAAMCDSNFLECLYPCEDRLIPPAEQEILAGLLRRYLYHTLAGT